MRGQFLCVATAATISALIAVPTAAQDVSGYGVVALSNVGELNGATGFGARAATRVFDRVGVGVGILRLENRARRTATLCNCYFFCPPPPQQCNVESIQTETAWRNTELIVFYEPLIRRQWRARLGLGRTLDDLSGSFKSLESDQKGEFVSHSTPGDWPGEKLLNGGTLLFAEVIRDDLLIPRFRAVAAFEFRTIVVLGSTDTPAVASPFNGRVNGYIVRLGLAFDLSPRD